MNWKYTLGAGAGIGAILATFVAILMVKIGIDPGSFGGFLVISFGLMGVSIFLLKQIFQSLAYPQPSLKQLIPISFLTFIIPLFGITFGAPNSDIDTLVMIILIGTVGGLFWSTPFALWSVFYHNFKAEGTESIIDQAREEE